ncbi:ABC transporter permease [Caproiciproducens galactitolivorans]|uniref:ABC transporter permease n=1 Tax=Caproiciproducens galactitolivorans TaxID=642589 RepID=UPI0024090631|nr:ABC transporter permease [Caproiciproducens galactitolivorans]
MTQDTGLYGKMRFTEILHLVWINIMENKFKVILTSLGIIVGSATIVMVIAVGHGGEVDVQKQFKTLNAGSINISVSTEAEMRDQMMQGSFGPGGDMPGDMPSGMQGGMPGGMPGGTAGNRSGSRSGFGGNLAKKQSAVLSTTDVDTISSLVTGLSDVSIYTSATAKVEGGDLTEETEYTTVGVQSNYQSICNLELLQGDFISDDDQDSKNKVAVIGYTLAQDIFGSAYSAVGESLSIEGKTYEIVGVLSKMGSVSSGISPDNSIFVPYSTALKYVFGNNAVSQITAIVSDVNQVAEKMEEIKSILMEDHSNANFTVTDAGSSMEAATSSAKTLSRLLIAVACIVFIVGGIGIMNVLFVSVKERTQEIGILKALGCSKREILLEFLSEANFISIFGGVMGVAAGFALVPVVRLSGMTVAPLAVSGIYAMLFAVCTGTLFGFYPAWKAASLMPIEALSQK